MKAIVPIDIDLVGRHLRNGTSQHNIWLQYLLCNTLSPSCNAFKLRMIQIIHISNGQKHLHSNKWLTHTFGEWLAFTGGWWFRWSCYQTNFPIDVFISVSTQTTIQCAKIASVTSWQALMSIDWMVLTHWGRDKMTAISQTTFSNAFSWMKMY